MKISIVSFTKNGMNLSKDLFQKLKDGDLEIFLYYKCSQIEEEKDISEDSPVRIRESMAEWTKSRMQEGSALLFIGACGIAVRSIAPCITDKLQDVPVLVMDEKGKYIIPILAGHVGGANEMAERIAGKMGALPVITTATDQNDAFAVDLFAKRNHLAILNKEGIAKVSSKVLAGEKISISIEEGHFLKQGIIPPNIVLVPPGKQKEVDVRIGTKIEGEKAQLFLCPKEYIIGIGCKKGKREEQIAVWMEKNLKKWGINLYQVDALVSIDNKKEEEGLVCWSQKNRVPFYTYTAEELSTVNGHFTGSDFVKETVGVDNVCERAALYACLDGGRLICNKQSEDGMTIALAKKEWSITFDET